MLRKRSLYQIREYVGMECSKQLGRRLRSRSDALRIVRMLKKQGREVFAAPLKVWIEV